MTYEEGMKLPIPEKSKDQPNIYRLARILYSTGNGKEILAAMDTLFSAAGMKGAKEE